MTLHLVLVEPAGARNLGSVARLWLPGRQWHWVRCPAGTTDRAGG